MKALHSLFWVAQSPWGIVSLVLILTPTHSESRVIDGERSKIPQVIQISSARGTCSATVVGDLILTAAHCLSNGRVFAQATIGGENVKQELTCESHPGYEADSNAPERASAMSLSTALKQRLVNGCKEYHRMGATAEGAKSALRQALRRSLTKIIIQIAMAERNEPEIGSKRDYSKDLALCWPTTLKSKLEPLATNPACIEPPPERGSEEADHSFHVGFGANTVEEGKLAGFGKQRKAKANDLEVFRDGRLVTSFDRARRVFGGVLPGDSGGFLGFLNRERPVVFGVHSMTSALSSTFSLESCREIDELNQQGFSINVNPTDPGNLKFIRSVAKAKGLRVCLRTEPRAKLLPDPKRVSDIGHEAESH